MEKRKEMEFHFLRELDNNPLENKRRQNKMRKERRVKALCKHQKKNEMKK
jgi:hypothetical protein